MKSRVSRMPLVPSRLRASLTQWNQAGGTGSGACLARGLAVPGTQNRQLGTAVEVLPRIAPTWIHSRCQKHRMSAMCR
jgi:hypothetical protein